MTKTLTRRKALFGNEEKKWLIKDSEIMAQQQNSKRKPSLTSGGAEV